MRASNVQRTPNPLMKAYMRNLKVLMVDRAIGGSFHQKKWNAQTSEAKKIHCSPYIENGVSKKHPRKSAIIDTNAATVIFWARFMTNLLRLFRLSVMSQREKKEAQPPGHAPSRLARAHTWTQHRRRARAGASSVWFVHVFWNWRFRMNDYTSDAKLLVYLPV